MGVVNYKLAAYAADLVKGHPAAKVGDFARLQKQEGDGFIAVDEAEKGMAQMSEVYEETGCELYMGAGNREHD